MTNLIRRSFLHSSKPVVVEIEHNGVVLDKLPTGGGSQKPPSVKHQPHNQARDSIAETLLVNGGGGGSVSGNPNENRNGNSGEQFGVVQATFATNGLDVGGSGNGLWQILTSPVTELDEATTMDTTTTTTTEMVTTVAPSK